MAIILGRAMWHKRCGNRYATVHNGIQKDNGILYPGRYDWDVHMRSDVSLRNRTDLSAKSVSEEKGVNNSQINCKTVRMCIKGLRYKWMSQRKNGINGNSRITL